jgi:hypothetical protein
MVPTWWAWDGIHESYFPTTLHEIGGFPRTPAFSDWLDKNRPRVGERRLSALPPSAPVNLRISFLAHDSAVALTPICAICLKAPRLPDSVRRRAPYAHFYAAGHLVG